MTKRRKLMLWVGTVASFPASLYAGGSAVTYAWLNAASPERWPADKAAPWFYGALMVTVLFLGVFIFCLVALIKEANRQYRQEQGSA